MTSIAEQEKGATEQASPLSISEPSIMQSDQLFKSDKILVPESYAVRNNNRHEKPTPGNIAIIVPRPWWKRKHLMIGIGTSLLLAITMATIGTLLASRPRSSANLSNFKSGIEKTTKVQVQITYDISNDCGLDGNAVMNEVGNTLKTGLVDATTRLTRAIITEKFPQSKTDLPSSLRMRKMSRLLPNKRISSPPPSGHLPRMLDYTEASPVTIDRIIDIKDGCDAGKNCLLIISTITVIVLEEEITLDVSNAILHGLLSSFEDGTFYDAIPLNAVVCHSDPS